MSKHFDVKLIGTVQGVGLRYSTSRKARELGVLGFIRNEPDGSVTAELEGGDGTAEKLLDWLENGFDYPGRHTLRAQEGEIKGYKSFEIQY